MTKGNKKYVIISIIAVVITVIVAIIIGRITYAFIDTEEDDIKRMQGEITAAGNSLIFIKGTDLGVDLSTDNFNGASGNLVSISNPKVKLIPADPTEGAIEVYNVGFYIGQNTYQYAQTGNAELILYIEDEDSEITSITNGEDTINRISITDPNDNTKTISGFDITGLTGFFTVDTNHEITSNVRAGTTQEWTFKLTFVNYTYDQSINEDAELSLQIVMQQEELDICDFDSSLEDCETNAIAYVAGNDLTITVDKAIDNFTGLLLDGSVVSTDNYTATSGSTIVTLRSSYLETLDQGPHILTFEYTSGNINRTISIPYTYDTAEEHTLTIEKSGYYKLEVWGAQGGSGLSSYTIAGYGGYSVGIVYLSQNESLFINVGGQGQTGYRNSSKNGGYNGGGSGWDNAANDALRSGGGGATHISTVTGLLSSLEAYKNTGNSQNTSSYYVSDEILIVAGGGGGDSLYNSSQYGRNGDGGGYIGINGTGTGAGGGGGTQISGGESSISNTFGTGENAIFGKGADALAGVSSYGGSGGGGGFYGGGHSYNNANGGGGSGYIASSRLTSGGTVTKHMATYGATGNYLSNDTETKTIAATSVSETATADYAKIGDGYARITYCGDSADSCD